MTFEIHMHKILDDFFLSQRHKHIPTIISRDTSFFDTAKFISEHEELEDGIAVSVISIIKPPLGMSFLYVISFMLFPMIPRSSQNKGLMQRWNIPQK